MYSELQREAAAAAAAAAAAPSSPWERARASFGFKLLLPTWHAGESDDDITPLMSITRLQRSE